jgi:hypothetical protein
MVRGSVRTDRPHGAALAATPGNHLHPLGYGQRGVSNEVVLMEPIEDIQRSIHWPEIDTSRGGMTGVWHWLKTYQAKHMVYLPQTHFTGPNRRTGMQDWLTEQYGPAMIYRSGAGHYYWTCGRWVSMVKKRQNNPDGREYLFVREDEAFEFKMRWV